MTKRLKTNIKFKKNAQTGQFFGFVTKKGSSWRGCDDTECKKRIVFVDRKASSGMVENALYHVTLIPMKVKDGFIAITAEIIKFDAKIETTVDGGVYKVDVRFGNRCITYEPESKDKRKNDITTIADKLRARIDLQDPERVVNDFLEAATIVRAYQMEA